MNVSLNYIADNLGFNVNSIGLEDLTKRVGSQLGAIEDVIKLAPQWRGAVVAKVASCQQHPNADKLHVCLVDDGGVSKDVQRNNDGLVTVVCGAPNVHEDMLVVWLPPGATVPATYSDKEPFVLSPKELRGILSNGMLASPSELGLSNDHDGILELTNKDFANLPTPGTLFVDLLGLNDVVLDLENKMFTHRPDCFGHIGVARELAGISGQAFKSPEWYLNKVNLPDPKDVLGLNIQNQALEVVPRFMMQAISNIKVGPSPLWLQAFLARIGQKSVNNIVDITNYMMLITGQPLHAFDYDKVAKVGEVNALGPRMARSNEKIALLNGKTINLSSNDIVIAAGDTPIALAGVMGGSDTEVDANTKNIIIECATFNMYAVRRTSMRHGLFTDAVTRYTKGQSPLQNDVVLAKTVHTILGNVGGSVASGVFDESDKNLPMPNVVADIEFINRRLGSDLSAKDMAQLLQNVEIAVNYNDHELTITPPFWRTDLAIPEDIVEEIGRLYGYDKLPVNLPKRTINPAKQDTLVKFKSSLKNILKNIGGNELLTYSFVHQKLLLAAQQKPEDSYALSNAISPALQYYRQSITPSLLDKVHLNVKAGYDKFALFEIGKGHSKLLPLDSKVPKEQELLAYVYAALPKSAPVGAAYYQAKMAAQEIFNKLGINVKFETFKENDNNPLYSKMFDPLRSAFVYNKDNQLIGVVGEYLSSTKKALKLPTYCSGFELEIDKLVKYKANKINYIPSYKYPSIEQDITLESDEQSSYNYVYDAVSIALSGGVDSDIEWVISPLNIYVKENIKRFSFRLNLTPKTKTLTSQEVNVILDKVVNLIKKDANIKRI